LNLWRFGIYAKIRGEDIAVRILKNKDLTPIRFIAQAAFIVALIKLL